MRKLGDEASERSKARGDDKDMDSSEDRARGSLDGGVEKPLQKLIEKILGSRSDDEVHGQEGRVGDDTR